MGNVSISNVFCFLARWIVLIQCVCFVASSETENRFALIEDLVLPEGYPLERHVVLTDDGYRLALFRIPHGRTDDATHSRPVVYLQHGLLDTSATFLMNGPSRALGFALVESGFDVWLGNTRGNTFSDFSFQSGNIDHDQFWDFSLDEIAKYDLPALLEYVLKETGVETLSYLGHSQGTAAAHALFSTRHPITKRISVAVMLSPVAFVKHITSHFVKSLAAHDTDHLVSSLGYKKFFPNLAVYHKLGGPICRHSGPICADIFALLYGYNPRNIDARLWGTYLTYTPAGASVKLMIHWAQGVRNPDSGTFQMYDYGNKCWELRKLRRLRCNRNMYGTKRPPTYDLSQIQVPLALFSGGHDALADITDVTNLKGHLSPGVLVADHVELDYTHLDLIWGMDSVWKIHPYIISILKEWDGKRWDHNERKMEPVFVS